jgi:phosphoheptose isomerase
MVSRRARRLEAYLRLRERRQRFDGVALHLRHREGASYNRDTRFRMMALADSLATLTAYSNEIGYECIFVEQLKNFAQAGDLVMCISGSGNSPNVVRAGMPIQLAARRSR